MNKSWLSDPKKCSEHGAQIPYGLGPELSNLFPSNHKYYCTPTMRLSHDQTIFWNTVYQAIYQPPSENQVKCPRSNYTSLSYNGISY